MRDILRFTIPGSDQKTFGGKTVVLCGDFRQILPVIPKATRPMVDCKVLRLMKNLRLQSLALNEDRQTVDWFSRWIADIGDEITGFVNNGLFEIDIPPRFRLKCGPDLIATIVESIFPTAKYRMLKEPHLEGRSILSLTLDVDQINQYMCDMNTAEGRTYLSCDLLCKAESDGDNLSQVHTPEFSNSLRLSGLPNHSLTIKVGAHVMLLWNIDHSLGICNDTRLIVTRLADHIVEARIVNGTQQGNKVLKPRMSLTPSDTRLSFKLQRKTINKSRVKH
ncbi:PREDICTED: uncharacterized protein LOC109156261 [Ipomoea nil]|uniref:uncharacterized protein LOC109156261 n=1 Tax=Ipomoea nil TaxID=35883 RepID=UPI000900BFE4|nr:PREDICTED: uncharacterized protein LOC109156261 [Ipomoea nil]